jgi:hypothetical protein
VAAAPGEAQVIPDNEKDLPLLLADVHRLAALYGAKALREVLLGYASTAVPDPQFATRSASGAVALTAKELETCEKRGLDPAKMLATKVKAIADGTYPAVPE